jgi:hypothetical protein
VGKVPRVESYAHAVNEARYFETDFGRVHTVGIRELVEIKKTQRAEDYPIIGRLVLAEIESRPDPSPADLRWALDNVFSLRELEELLAGQAARIAALEPPPVAPLLRAARYGRQFRLTSA